MARINSLTNFLDDVATAIKQKTGDNTPIPASEFDTEILSIETAGTYQQKTLTITQNGQTTLTPDTGFDAMDQVAITVNVPIKQLQSKTVSITSNGNVTLLPDTDYDGFDEVNLQVNVPTGSGSGDVKLFPTEQAMQADEDPHVNDLAIVYGSSVVPLSSTLNGQISCPNTFTLSEAITTNYRAYYYATGGGWSELYFYINATTAYIRDYNTGNYIVRYTSEDGTTYTQSTNNTPYTLSESYELVSGTISPFNQFVTVNSISFNGLFTYSDTVIDYDKVQLYGPNNITNFTYDGTTYTWDGTYPFLITYTDLKPTLTAILNDSSITKYNDTYMYMYIKNNKYYVISTPVDMSCLGAYQNEGIIGIANSNILSSVTTHTIKIYELDITNTSYTLTNTLTSSLKSFTNSSGTTQYLEYIPIIPDSLPMQIYLSNLESYTGVHQVRTVYQVSGQTYYSYTNKSCSPAVQSHPYKSEYILAPTQFSLSASQALQNTIAYSNNGVITGTIPLLGSRTITPSLEQQTIGAGYTTGITIKAADATTDSNALPMNIKEGSSVLGVNGICPDTTVIKTYTGKQLTTKRSADTGSPNASGQHNVIIIYDLHGNIMGCIKWGSEYRSTYFYLYGYNKTTDQFVNSTYVSLSTPFRNIYDSGRTFVSYMDDYGIAYLWFQSSNQTTTYYSDLCCLELKYNYATNTWAKGENYWMYDLFSLYTGSYTPRNFTINEKRMFINVSNRRQIFISGSLTSMRTSSETSNLETTYHTATFELSDNHTMTKLSYSNFNFVDYIAMGNIFNDGKLIIYNGIGDNYYDAYQSYKTDMIVLDDDFKIVKISKALGRIQYYDPKSDRVVMSTSGKQYSLYKINIDYSTGDITYTLLQTLGTNNLHTNNIISLDGKYLLDWHSDFMTLYQNENITLYEVDLDATNIYKTLITDVYGTSESSGTLTAYDRDRVFITLTSRYNGSPVRWFRPTGSEVTAITYAGITYYPEKLKQTKTITPIYSQQIVTPDTGYELESVIVNEIPAVTLDIENATVENGVLEEVEENA